VFTETFTKRKGDLKDRLKEVEWLDNGGIDWQSSGMYGKHQVDGGRIQKVHHRGTQAVAVVPEEYPAKEQTWFFKDNHSIFAKLASARTEGKILDFTWEAPITFDDSPDRHMYLKKIAVAIMKEKGLEVPEEEQKAVDKHEEVLGDTSLKLKPLPKAPSKARVRKVSVRR